jgi:hypothetical protein
MGRLHEQDASDDFRIPHFHITGYRFSMNRFLLFIIDSMKAVGNGYKKRRHAKKHDALKVLAIPRAVLEPESLKIRIPRRITTRYANRILPARPKPRFVRQCRRARLAKDAFFMA